MKPSQGAAAENCLCEMLDALEAGVLQLLQQRNELRAILAQVGKPHSVRQPKRPKIAHNGKSPRRSRASEVRTDKTDSPFTSTAPGKLQNEPPTRKTRNALGRSLTQIRATRNQAIRDEEQNTQ